MRCVCSPGGANAQGILAQARRLRICRHQAHFWRADMASRVVLSAVAGVLSVTLFGCGDNCEQTVTDALASVPNSCSGMGNVANSECQCTFQTDRLAVFTANADGCSGNTDYYPAALAAQESAKTTGCCDYLVVFANNTYNETINSDFDPNVAVLYCNFWNTAYLAIEGEFDQCADTVAQQTALAATLAKCEEIDDNNVCCPSGRCNQAQAKVVV